MRTEMIFGGFLVLALVIAAGLHFTSSGNNTFAGFNSGAGNGNESVQAEFAAEYTTGRSQSGLQFDDARISECGCYTNAFANATTKSLDSVTYQSGYSACKMALGNEGVLAWTVGWDYGRQQLGGGTKNKRSVSKCGFYKKLKQTGRL